MALITLSVMANALSVTCAVSWHISIERPETNYQVWLPDKAPIPTHFPRQTESGGGCWNLSNSRLTMHEPASPTHPPSLSLNSNCPACSCLLMWEKRTAVQWSWGKLNLKRREPYGLADLFTSWLMWATEGPQWDSWEMASKPEPRRLW